MNKQEIINYSKKITKHYGLNYYRATSLFPKKIREVVYVYYAWVRHADQLVDILNPKIKLLQEWIKDFAQDKSQKELNIVVKKYFEIYNVPEQYPKAFLTVMEQDLSQKRYDSYKELEGYMYGSAAVIGLTMLCFFGLHKQQLIPGATKLGEAMQLTNFLRDIREDYEDLGRIYLPQEDMKNFGVTDQNIADYVYNENFKQLMKFEVERCRDLYRQAWPAIQKLAWKLKFPIRIATRNYEGVLSEIEKANYNIWNKRHRLSSVRKILVIIKSLFV